MIIEMRNMDSLYRSYNTAFQKAILDETEARPNILAVKDVAIEMPVTGASTQHSWLGQIKGMTEWVGARVLEALRLNAITVVSRKFEDSLAVPADAIRDDQYGQFTPLAAALGAASGEIWLDLVGESLTGNAVWADGNPFFCSGRKLGDATITNAVTTALSRAAVEAGIAAMTGYTLHKGRPAKVRPEVLVVGPSQLAAAKAIVEADIIANTEGTAGISNVSTARMLRVVQCDAFVGAKADWWTIAGRKATIPLVCVQQREKPASLTRMDRDSDYNVFMTDTYYYGTRARGEAFLTLPVLGYLGGVASVSAWSQAAADAVVGT